jgi:hypothetical protein
MILTKQQFCEAIDAYRKQMRNDAAFSSGLDKLLGTEVEFMYDNSEIMNAFMFMLQTMFKSVDKKGNCLIEQHLFGSVEFDSATHLYDELIKRNGNGNN